MNLARTTSGPGRRTVLVFLAATLLLSLATTVVVPTFEQSPAFSVQDSSAVYRHDILKDWNTSLWRCGIWWSRAKQNNSVSIDDNLDGGQAITVHHEQQQQDTQQTSLRRRQLVYTHRNQRGGKSKGSVLYTILSVLFFLFFVWLRFMCGPESLESMRAKNRQWVREEESPQAAPSAQASDYRNFEKEVWKLPSGMLWEGSYKQLWSEHKLPAFQLESSPMEDNSSGGNHPSSLPHLERLTGSGNDDVGPYKLIGTWNPATGRLSFTKTYTGGSGFFSPKGHAVEYKGTMMTPPSSSLPQNQYHQKQAEHATAVLIVGTWSFPAHRYTETGSFAFWPVDRATTTSSYRQPVVASNALQDDSGKSAPLISKAAGDPPSLELT